MRPAPDTGTGRAPAIQAAAEGANHPTTNETTRGDLMIRYTPSAGDRGPLAAAASLQDPMRQTFTRDQVAYLMHLAYDSGRTAAHREDIARLYCTSEDSGWVRPTYEQRVAAEVADLTARSARLHAALGHPPGYEYRGGPVDWETGRPVRHLEVAAA